MAGDNFINNPANEKVYIFPTSFAQQRLWFLDQFEPNSPFYNIPSAIRFKGELNFTVFSHAVNEIIRRHEVLRTTFQVIDDMPCQVVHSFKHHNFPFLNISEQKTEEKEQEIIKLAKDEAKKPFDLQKDRLIRVTVIKADERDWIILITMHHIISDGWSMGIFVREVATLYDAFSKGVPSPLPDLDIQYGDFAEWQQEYIKGQVLERQIEYWKKQLAAPLPILELPGDRPRPAVQTMVGANEHIVIPKETSHAFKDMVRKEKCTLYMGLLAGFQILLKRYTGLEDILVGSPIANRHKSEIEPLIGFFVNTLVLRAQLTGDTSFKELLQQVRKITLEAFENQDLPFERLVEELQPNRDMSHSPLFQVMFILQNTPMHVEAKMTDVSWSTLSIDAGTSTFDLTLMVNEGPDGFLISAEYNTDIFAALTIRRFLQHYKNLLNEIVLFPENTVSRLNFISHDEQRDLVETWNDYSRSFPSFSSVHQLVEKNVTAFPEQIAIAFEGENLTYYDLNIRANKLAYYLRKFAVREEERVSIILDKSLFLPVAVLATLKAGGAYVPIDPTYPKDRIAYMLEDSRAHVIITQKVYLELLPKGDFSIILLDDDWPIIEQQKSDNLSIYPDSQNLAYVIYTSGSTGKAKGTMISHESLLNAYFAWEHDYQLTTRVKNHLQMASFAFDVFTGDFVRALCSGGKLVLVPREILLQADKLYALMLHEKIDCAEFVPAVLRNLINYLQENNKNLAFMENLIAGSDIWTVQEYKKFKSFCGEKTKLINSFGLTEATIDSTFFQGDTQNYVDERLVPIGRPFANSQIYIIDEFFNLSPLGVPGELLVAGINCARGYLNRPDLTAEKFVPNPFSKNPGSRVYRTGDLARWLPDGNVEFLGRIDFQVKIRGFRVEMGEIESVLEKHSDIKKAVVIAREDQPGDKRIVGYMVCEDKKTTDLTTIRQFCSEFLPDYMIPSAFVVLDVLPLTPNGKIDRISLPAPDAASFETGEAFVEAKTETEIKLVKIWQAILGVEKIGVKDNFFLLGGHSLLATQVVSRVREIFKTELPLRKIFECVTIADLGCVIEQAQSVSLEDQPPPISRKPDNAENVLSFAQERLWFLDQLEPNSPFYNIPEAVRIKGPLDIFRLEKCLNQIIERHDILRTSFSAKDGKPFIHIKKRSDVDISLIDMRHLPQDEREKKAAEIVRHESQDSFDLQKGPLFRVRLINIDYQDFIFLMTIHHIISDAWSSSVIIGEMARLYDAYDGVQNTPLLDLPVQYQDYAYWQRNWLKGKVLEKQIDFWKKTLEGSPPVINLPTDRPRPSLQTAHGDYISFTLSNELTRRLQEIGQKNGATMFMTLLSVFFTLLFRYSGQDDINIGTPIANRSSSQVEGLVGFFVNTIVLRADLSGAPSFLTLLQRIKKRCLDAFAHQDVPFEKIVDALAPERELSHTPLFQVMFSMLNAAKRSTKTKTDLTIAPVEAHSGTAKFDITLFMVEEHDTLSGAIEYNSDLFDRVSIKRLIAHFKKLLFEIVQKPDRAISEYSFILPVEKQKIFYDWNGKNSPHIIEKNIIKVFEEIVFLAPYNIAIEYKGTRLAYIDLNRKANCMAYYLQKHGVKQDTLVGLSIDHSPEMIIAMLAILKAGGAYVPLDPGYPEERLTFMLQDSKVSILVTKRKIENLLPECDSKIIRMDWDWEKIEQCPENNPNVDVDPDNLAYMIYTSGSTGKPKGTLITHRGLVNYLDWTYKAYPLEKGCGSIVHSTIAFDATVTAVFTPLLTGKTIFLVPDRADIESLGAILKIHKDFSVIKITPAHLDMLSHQVPPESACFLTHSYVIGGENLTAEQISFWQKNARDTFLFNEYGPTETVVGCVVYQARTWKGMGSVPIGRAITNTFVYVLDDNLKPVPVGVPGELYISGEGVARGYFNRADLTAERFVPNPFTRIPGSRMYKTGDIVRYLNDGNLIFLGRIDSQVKIRGYRIELSEIDAVAQQLDIVENSVTVVREDIVGDKRLVIYFIPKDNSHPDPEELRQYLADRLPEYMIPAALVSLTEFPLTSNGKLDKKALPLPDYRQQVKIDAYVAARSPQEVLLVKIWQEILHVDKIGIHDNFFSLGGHSLLATQVIARIRDVFSLELPLRLLFEAPTIFRLSKKIDQQRWQKHDLKIPELVPVKRSEHVPLSFAQQRLWFLHQLDPDSPQYNIPAAVKLVGDLDVSVLNKTIHEIIKRHESLRTVFKQQDGKPFQVVLSQVQFSLPIMDISSLEEKEKNDKLLSIVTENAMAPFNLEEGPLYRTALVILDEQSHVILFTMHHIISDGWSTGVLMGEVAAIYDNIASGNNEQLADLKIQYADYAVWQRRWLKDNILEEQINFWKNEIGENPPVLDLLTDFPRPARQTFNGDAITTQIPADISRELAILSEKYNATLFMTLLTTLFTLLHRYTHQDTILVGSPIANRTLSETEGLIGFFVNTLIFKANFIEKPTFSELLNRVREFSLEAYAHQDIPFEYLVDKLEPERDMSRSPLFQILFVFQNTPANALALNTKSLKMQVIEPEKRAAKYDLTVVMAESADGLLVEFEYNSDLFKKESMLRMQKHFVHVLQAIVSDPNQNVSDVQLVSNEEAQIVTEKWNDTQVNFPHHMCIHQLFEQRCEKTPEKDAVIYNNKKLTFQQLNGLANQIARHLRAKGIRTENLVAISVEKTLEMVVGLLAVLKAGGVYVPIDPDYPKERIQYILDDAKIDILLTQEHLQNNFEKISCDILAIDRLDERVTEYDVTNLDTKTLPDNLAYMIYTSGSTGHPKGTMVQHKGLVNLTLEQIKDFQLDESCRCLQFASFSFDASVSEIFTTLISGATLILADKEQLLPGQELVSLLKEMDITTVTLPPSVLKVLKTGDLSQVKTIISAGEACSKEIALEWSRGRKFLNAYGPTENTVCASRYFVTAPLSSGNLPIGKPLGNIKLYILDENQQIAAIGIPGELCIAGVGLARGYFNRPDLTAEKFIPNPFAAVEGERLYRTGDLVRYLPDGNIEFLGRIDQQVKLRGFRIELGEIEHVIRQYAGIRDVVVEIKKISQKDSEFRLVAYLVLKSEFDSAEALEEYIKQRLPHYMVPHIFVELEVIPLTAHGKINRKALPVPDKNQLSEQTEYVAPRNKNEELLLLAWNEILGLDRMSIHANFFKSGGHSLLATQLVSRIRELFKIEIPVAQIFETPTVASMAEKIADMLKDENNIVAPPIRAVDRNQELPLSFSQQRLWFLDQLDPGNTSFNLTDAVKISGDFSPNVFKTTLAEIIGRHEVLRTTFQKNDNGMPVQVISTSPRLDIKFLDLSTVSKEERKIKIDKIFKSEIKTPFNLTEGPLVRSKLIKVKSRTFILILTMHHIVSDAWSMGLFVKEFAAIYQAKIDGKTTPLPGLTLQYADFAFWQRFWLQGEVLERELAFWRKRMQDSTAVLDLPIDKPRPAVKTFNGSQVRFEISEKQTHNFLLLCEKQEVTPFIFLEATFAVLLYRYSGQDDINIGSPIANRNRIEIEQMIGFFVNTLVFRNDLSGFPTFRQFLQRVKKMALENYAHQDVPFEKIVEILLPERDLSHTPLFQVMFVFQNTPVEASEIKNIGIESIYVENNHIQYDMVLNMQRTANYLAGAVQFNTDLFNKGTINRLVFHFKNLLDNIFDNLDMHIDTIPLMSRDELELMTQEWNRSVVKSRETKCAHKLFELIAEKYPKNVALQTPRAKISYNQLNILSNKIANLILGKGVRAENIVGICLERSVEMVASVLAVLKAGAAYVPLDPAYPKDRLEYMISDANIRIILSHSSLQNSLPSNNCEIIFLDKQIETLKSISARPPHIAIDPENLAYVIYTSGSTGRPKGTLLRHSGLCNLSNVQIKDFYVNSQSKVLQFASFSFDASVSEIFMALHSGATLYLADRETLLSPAKLARLINEEQMTVVTFPPTMLSLLSPEEIRPLKTIVSAGESCPKEIAVAFSKDRRFVNAYGPTEATVGSCSYAVESITDAYTNVPIGKPYGNVSIYIVDVNFNPVPVGVRGELCIAGIGLGRGYLNRPDLTAEKFIPNPFEAKPGARMYRTGDLAAYLPDGKIQFLGRIDEQVKVRGFRIELGEIEETLLKHEGVRDVVVIARKVAGYDTPNHLAAYIIKNENFRFSAGDLRFFLENHLPDYMLPNSFVFVKSFPLTPSGKVNKKALPIPKNIIEDKTRKIVLPSTKLEKEIADLVIDLLNISSMGITDNFFEFGGHSLMAIQLLTRIQKKYNQEIPLVELFKNPTIKGLAKLIEEKREDYKFDPCLVRLYDNNGYFPLFLIHPSGGSVHWYAELARELGEKIPVYGLQAKGVNGDDLLHTTIEQMAEHYVDVIKSVQKEGPYFLSSWSMGVSIAFEVAQQLSGQHNEIGLLAMLDQGPTLPRDIPDDVTDFLLDMFMGRLKFRRARLRKLDYNEQLRLVLERAQKVGLLEKDITLEQFRHYVRILKVQMDAWRNYKPVLYQGDLVLIKGKEQSDSNQEEDLGWSRYVKGQIMIYQVPGNHNTMLWKQNVKFLAAQLKRLILNTFDVE